MTNKTSNAFKESFPKEHKIFKQYLRGKKDKDGKYYIKLLNNEYILRESSLQKQCVSLFNIKYGDWYKWTIFNMNVDISLYQDKNSREFKINQYNKFMSIVPSNVNISLEEKNNNDMPPMLVHIANERDANIGTHKLLKKMGVQCGFPDIMILHNKKKDILFIELKTLSGSLSKKQEVVKEYFALNTYYKYVICRNIESFEKECDSFLDVKNSEQDLFDN